ncbi:MAG: hypothetical protein R3E18_12495 [Sphingomonadaceae bacterium]|nr:hypothetical protein [Sphingomonadaceae bacterium]
MADWVIPSLRRKRRMAGPANNGPSATWPPVNIFTALQYKMHQMRNYDKIVCNLLRQVAHAELSIGHQDTVIQRQRQEARKIMEQDAIRKEPARARALLSTADFRLLREALASHARVTEDREELAKINALHHRLGTYN